MKEKNQVYYYGDDDGMLNWKKLGAVGLCLGKFFYFNILQTTQNQNPKNNKDYLFSGGKRGQKVVTGGFAVAIWACPLEHKMNYGTKTALALCDWVFVP